jgi:WD40 repeat protein
MRLRAVLWTVVIGITAALIAGSFAHAEDSPKIEIVPQLGHWGMVRSVALAPDGKTALSGSHDKTLMLWDLASGREIRKFEGHSDAVNSVVFAPDGKTALSGSSDNTLRLWDLASGREIRRFEGHSDAVNSVVFAPDGKTALSASSDNTLRLWDLATGREIRRFEGHSGPVNSVVFAPDGKTALSGSHDKTLRLWDLASGREIRRFEGHLSPVCSVAIAPDRKTALSGGADPLSASWDKKLRLWDLASGREIQKFEAPSVISIAFAPDGKTALSGSPDNTFILWDLASGREIKKLVGYSGYVGSIAFAPDGKTALSGGTALGLWDLANSYKFSLEIRRFEGHSRPVTSIAVAPDGKTALSGSADGTLRLWDLASGRKIKTFEWHSEGNREGLIYHSEAITSVAFAPDGKTALSVGGDSTLRLWDLASGREIRKFQGHLDTVNSVAFAPDGKTALSGSDDKTLRLWDLTTSSRLWDLFVGPEIKKIEAHSRAVTSVAFAPDGKTALSGGATLSLWDLASGREIRRFEGHSGPVNSVVFAPDGRTALSGACDEYDSKMTWRCLKGSFRLWDLASGREIRKIEWHSDGLTSFAFAPDGKAALLGRGDNSLRLWDLAGGREIKTFEGHSGPVNSVAFAPDGKTALSGSSDGTIRLWDLKRGEASVSLSASSYDSYLAITPKGFFTASARDTDMLAIVRGLEITTIGQFYQSLYNPDLIREALAGDPNHEVDEAAKLVNLDKVLDSGPPPLVEIASNQLKSQTDFVSVTARVMDRGKGVGRIEWRVNGVTAAVTNASSSAGPEYEVTQTLALDPGENIIEVVAYNARNLLASLPALATITYNAPADAEKPKLYVLAIGVNAYDDEGWTPPGATRREYFPPLKLAVDDARSVAEALKEAGSGFYGQVIVRTAFDKNATAAGLERIIQDLSAEINPRDTFVLFAAGHGYSNNGRFYLLPQDYEGGTNPAALMNRAIGQDRLQDWIAHIKARRGVILLDTCESGALTNGYIHSRTDAPAAEAAVGLLHEATGRPILTAAAAGKPAFEGYHGHGVFTWALIDALFHGDSNGDGLIELSELAAHVENTVPKISAEMNGRGVAEVLTQIVKEDRQTAHFGSTGSDFPVVRRLQ